MRPWQPASVAVDESLESLSDAIAGRLNPEVNIEAIVALLLTGQVSDIADIVFADRNAVSYEHQIMLAAGEWAETILMDVMPGTADAVFDTYGLDIEYDFDYDNLHEATIAFFIQQIALIAEESRRGVERVITDGSRSGMESRELAALIAVAAGLTERQAVSLMNYRMGLIQGGIPLPAVAQLVRTHAGKLLADRARVVALHFSVWTADLAQGHVYELVIRAHTSRMFQFMWITQRDEKVCPFCGPMEGQTVTPGQPFVSGDGELVMGPPIHPRCRCGVDLILL